jgi:hypothetical protein
MLDMALIQSAINTSALCTYGVFNCIVSIGVAAAIVFSKDEEDIGLKGVAQNSVVMFCLIHGIYGLFQMVPNVLAVALEHNETYNKKFAQILQERIVTFSDALSTTTINEVTRAKLTASCQLLKAVHDEVHEHPMLLKVFGVPITTAIYGRIIALSFSLLLSMLLRVVMSSYGNDVENSTN